MNRGNSGEVRVLLGKGGELAPRSHLWSWARLPAESSGGRWGGIILHWGFEFRGRALLDPGSGLVDPAPR